MDEPGRILVVDDNRTNVVILVKSLQKHGYDVLVADNGFDAVNVAVAEQPDLILLDVMMPDRDGLEVCQTLKSREETAAIPIIFVTARSNTNDVIKAFEAGGSDYITKPFQIAEILARTSVHIRLRQAEKGFLREQKEAADLAAKLAETNLKLAELTRVDPLTGLLNRRAWEESADLEQSRSQRTGGAYSILMIDVDRFKRFNDTQGHQAGDKCLCRIARSVSSACRAADLVGRYGGEEFVVLAPDTALAEAIILGERVRRSIWNLDIPHPTSSVVGRVTASVGVAACTGGSWEETLREADDALYLAKRSGRDTVFADRRPAQRRASPPNDTGKSRSPGVLVVDDDSTRRAWCTECLHREGYTVIHAADAAEAVAKAAGDDPDAIIVDADMSGRQGFSCARTLKTNLQTRDIPLIMAGRGGASGDVSASRQAGADECLTKPVDREELILRVRSMVRLHRERRDLRRSYELRGEQARVLTLLLDYCRALAATEDLDQALEHTVTVAAKVASCGCISILLPDRNHETLTIVRSSGTDEEQRAKSPFKVGECIAKDVFQTGRPKVLNAPREAESESYCSESPPYASVPLVSTPLSTSGKAMGVLNITGRIDGRPFEARELEYIDLIAKIAGSAIHSLLSQQARDQARDSIVVALAKLAEHRDNDTGKHVDRVTRYSLILARELRRKTEYQEEIDDEFLHSLERAVPLHDIGKVAIPDEILCKPGKLTREEMTVMQSHAEIGARTIRSVVERAPGARFLEMAEQIARSHHEWVNGTGYPEGRRGSETPLCARIVALADVYDALTTKRVYKDAYSHAKAKAIIRQGSGMQFDPAVVESFLVHEAEFARLSEELRDEIDTGRGRSYDAQRGICDGGPREYGPPREAEPVEALTEFINDPTTLEQFENYLQQLHDNVAVVEKTFVEQDIGGLVAAAQELSARADPSGVTPLAQLTWRLSRSGNVKDELQRLAADVEALAGICRTAKAPERFGRATGHSPTAHRTDDATRPLDGS